MTETAAVTVQHNADIINDRRVQALIASDARASAGGGSQGVAYGNANYGNTSGNSNSRSGTSGNATITPATPVQPAGPQNGTYTFWPRLRAWQAGVAVDFYIAQITVTRDFMVIHYCRTATGPFKESEWEYAPSGFYSSGNFILQDLNNPSRSYNPISARSTDNGMGRICSTSFNRINATRFKLECKPYGSTNPPYVFEEIVLGEPDQ
jgi:hypothetical protein